MTTKNFDDFREEIEKLNNSTLKERENKLRKSTRTDISETELAIVRHELFKRGGVSAIHKRQFD